ncbi:hypothetical protein CEQ90_08960 [Lewinellaceae bacterium SD302]|nr:hypothetical protein CEQ90_08960 [Lewinellaceae bacterium SD302]
MISQILCFSSSPLHPLFLQTSILKFPFFKADLPPTPIQLLSVHIPKTAGTSFRHLLKEIYGENGVARVDLPLHGKRLQINEQNATPEDLPKTVAVLHGHYNPLELKNYFPEAAAAPIITWLRHPVDRVISNYFYLRERLAEELDEAGRNLNILSKMQRTLMEYARDELNQNRQHKFLDGVPLTDFSFVGIQEYYNDEVAAMAKEFQWPPRVEAPQHNRTGSKPQVSEAEREEIAELNQLDMALYAEGLALREARLGEPKIELISIHIPKTGGTSFYRSLQKVYGNAVTTSYRRIQHQRAVEQYGSLVNSLNGQKSVIHGHLYYSEIAELHEAHDAKIICWLRDPIERLVSNYHFFKAGLEKPDRNHENYRKNKHRKKESLLQYAEREENRNVMHKFLSGLEPGDLFFVGLLENYDTDLHRLAKLLDWPEVPNERLNVGNYDKKTLILDAATRSQLMSWNAEDLALYETAKKKLARA